MENRKSKKGGKVCWFGIIGVILIVVVFVVVLLFQNKTEIINNVAYGKKTDSINCESDNFNYTFFEYDNSDRKTTTMHAVFLDDELDSISLTYILYYASSEDAEKSEAINHAAMNLSFYSNDLESDAVNTKYTELDDGLKTNMYITRYDIDSRTARYFYLPYTEDDANSDNKNNYSLQKVLSIYQDMGFSCVTKLDQ